MAFRRKDPRARQVVTFAKAAVAITNGDLLKKNGTSNNVTNNVSAGDAVLGIAVGTNASGVATQLVDVLRPGDIVIADVGSGTPASGDFKSCDIRNSASVAKDLAVGTDVSHDADYIYNGSTTTADCYFKHLQTVVAT